MAYPIILPISSEINTNNKDAVFAFHSYEEAENALANALRKLLGFDTELDMESQKVRYKTDNKTKKENIHIGWRTFNNSFYLSLTIFDEEGHSNLLETAIAKSLQDKEG